MKKEILGKLLGIVLAVGMITGLTACGSNVTDAGSVAAASNVQTTNDSNEADTAAESVETTEDTAVEKETVVAALIGTTTLYAYTDDEGNLIGYNIDVLDTVFENLPQYELKYEKTEFSSILPGLDSGLYRIGAQAFISNPERRENYRFSESFGKYVFQIVTTVENDDINSWRDLGGKTVRDEASNGPVKIYEAYNEEFPDNPINLEFIDNASQGTDDLLAGRMDFCITGVVAEKIKAEELGVSDRLKYVPFGDDAPDYFEENQYFGFIFAKDDTELAEAFNTELEKLIEDGTLGQISEKWFGTDEYATTIEEARAFRDSKE